LLLGEVDVAFLGAYAIGMFFSGHLGDRLDLRHFLLTGESGSSSCCSSDSKAYLQPPSRLVPL
jgi:hypothetical protein